MILQTRAKTLDLSKKPLLMGVLNLTPDSFSDGGQYFSPQAAIARAEELVEEGADLLDLGGESTRPGASPVSLDEEIRRVVPLVEILAQRLPEVPLSIDTTKAEVARRCLEEGASLINDVSALRFDPKMVEVARQQDVPVVLMHMQGEPRTMQANPAYGNVVEEILAFFKERVAFALERGLSRERILLDPGIGFGKAFENNLDILRNLRKFLSLEFPLVLGTSRKSFLGRLMSAAEPPLPQDRLEGTLATNLWAAQEGAHVLRVHDVKSVRRALETWRALSAHA